MKYIKPPTLSTSFSESGKSAKKRFDNILNFKAKKAGIIAFVLILALVCTVGALAQYQNDDGISEEILDITNKLYKYKNTSISDNKRATGIFEIIANADSNQTLKNVEVKTNEINVYYNINEAFPITFYDNDKNVNRYGLIAFSLIDNLDAINSIFDYKGLTTSFRCTRQMIISDLNKEPKTFAKSKDDFKKMIEGLSNVEFETRPILNNGEEYMYKAQTIDFVNNRVANAYKQYFEVTKVEIENYNCEIDGGKVIATFIYKIKYKQNNLEKQNSFNIKFIGNILEDMSVDAESDTIEVYGKTITQKEFSPIEKLFPKDGIVYE